MTLTLRSGSNAVLDGRLERRGRQLQLRLYYHRSFSRDGSADGSWTVRMRPDCSLSIAPASAEPYPFEPVWLHFDAKYRIDALGELVDEPDDPPAGDAAPRRIASRRDDLLKMHAYRDAVRRSVGAYVIFPGDEERKFEAYHKVLPGVGAFPLKPRADGDPTGAQNLRRFITDVLDHVASRLTARERTSFWTARAYDRQDLLRAGVLPRLSTGHDRPVFL